MIRQYDASNRSSQTILELSELLSDLHGIGYGARGYALTREKRFLAPYKEGIERLPDRLAVLEDLEPDEEHLAADLPELARLSHERAAAAKALVDRVDRGALTSENAALLERGQRVMDLAQERIRATIEAQQSVHQERLRSVQRGALSGFTTFAVGVVLALTMLVWLFRRLNREVRGRRKAESELIALNEELEERVQAGTAEIEQSRQLLGIIVENMPDAVFLKDLNDDLKIVMINEAGERLFGVKREAVLGRHHSEIFAPGLSEVCSTGDARISERSTTMWDSEAEFETPAGNKIIEMRKVPIDLNGGSIRYVMSIARDITGQKALEDQVRQMQRLESVGRLTGGVAHDFNNLLAVILGSVEMVREDLEDGSDAAAIADDALDATLRGADLVRRLLAFARQQHLKPAAVDLNGQVHELLPLLQRTLGEDVRVVADYGRHLWHARLDPTQVDDALLNMAVNARDAMPSGGVLTISTSNAVLDEEYAGEQHDVAPGDYVLLAVSDTGTGMSDEVIAKAFEPFFTTKRHGQGTGLGLSQVYGWVKQSGGHIRIYSELGHGTSIKLYFPRAAAGMEDVSDPRPVEAEPRGSETVLVVEDNDGVRKTVVRQLTDLGYSVIEAADGASALDVIWSQAEFSVLLTDIVMPGGMNGYQVAAEAEKVRPNIGVVFTSGFTESAANGLDSARPGIMISKPYSKNDLGKAIRTALDQPRASRK